MIKTEKSKCGERAGMRDNMRDNTVGVQLEFNVDDMTGEEIGYACEMIAEAGADEVFTTPVRMKKNRPGILFTVIGGEEEKEKLLRAIFLYTSTTGVRETPFTRHVMFREITSLPTPVGFVRKKVSNGYGAYKYKYEYEDIAKIAKENERPFNDVLRDVAAFDEKNSGAEAETND